MADLTSELAKTCLEDIDRIGSTEMHVGLRDVPPSHDEAILQVAWWHATVSPSVRRRGLAEPFAVSQAQRILGEVTRGHHRIVTST